jgi:hypothetical protein
LNQKKLIKDIIFFIFTLTLLSCSGGGGGGGQIPTTVPEVLPPDRVEDPTGKPITGIDQADPIIINLSDLAANSKYNINIKDPNGKIINPTGGFIVTSDENGNIIDHTIIQNLDKNVSDATFVINRGEINNLPILALGKYIIDVTDENLTNVATLNLTVTNNSRVSCTDSTGVSKASFNSTENVYISISKNDGLLLDGNYDVYVISDLNPVLENSDSLFNKQAAQIIVNNGSGSLDIGKYTSGVFDVIVDINMNAKFDLDIDLISRHHRLNPCFTVQANNSAPLPQDVKQPIITQICSDTNGNYRDVFDPKSLSNNIRNMYAYLSPIEQSLVQETFGVKKYVVNHQDIWTDQDLLTDVTAGIELGPAQTLSINQSPWLIWPRKLMTPGCYDVVADVNSDGFFSAGIDYVDNIDKNGNSTCGCRVATDTSTITISSHKDGDTVTTTAITLVGTINGSTISSNVIVTSGTQSSTFSITPTPNGNYTTTLPLFIGENTITVYAIYPDKTSASTTINITSDTGVSNQLFRVQLTWNGIRDMDLHVVRPNGVLYTGENSMLGESNCFFKNCKPTDLELDWGIPNYNADNPKLDIDGKGSDFNGTIENISMSEINDSGNYEIYVHAFDGTDTVPTVTIFINNTQVGQVTCGGMKSDREPPIGTSTTAVCHIGAINWIGNNGNFTADGSLSTNPSLP